MKTKILTSILLSVLVTCFVSNGLAIAANGNGAGLERVPVFIGFRQTPGPSEQALVRAHGGAIKYSYTLVPAIAASIPEPAIQGLMRNPNVTYIEPVIEVYAVTQTVPWGVERIGAPTVHDGGNKGEGVKVAIIDSGIDYTHQDLDGNYKGGKDFVNNDDFPMDDNGHGTHVAGTVAAEDNGFGVVGVAPEADLYALKVLGASGGGDYAHVIAALQWAKDNGIQVTNNSYGSTGDPGETVEAAFNNCPAVHVCAAGNNGKPSARGDNVIYPARYASCIAVAATDQSDSRASWSSTGPDVEISAPGVAINSTLLGGGYGYKQGTSMASPHVAGVVALMISGSGYSRETLQLTADDLGATGLDSQYGYGLVDADEAAGTSAPPPDDTTPPSAPTGLTASAGDSIVSLDWSDNTETDLAGYNVYSSTSSGVGYSLIATGVTTSEYMDYGLTNGTTYYYVVGAFDTSLNKSANSNEASATPADATSPAAPANLTATAGDGTVSLDWSDNTETDLAGYLVYRSTSTGGPYSLIATGLTTSEYMDYGPTNGTTYYYIVKAVDTSDNVSGSSVEVSATPQASDGSGTMHVGDLDGIAQVKGRSGNWEVFVTVTVHDENHQILSNAIVTGTWSGDNIVGTVWGTTGSDGTITFTTGTMKGGSYVTFTVNLITHETLTYKPLDNHEDEGDSTGTSITVPK